LEDIVTVIIAAGKGTRMKSDVVKVLHPLLGLPMLFYSIELSLSGIKAGKTIVVVGYQADRIQEMFKDIPIEFALQKEQLGTGHAVLQAIPFLKSFGGMVLILCGDVPLVKLETLRSFIDTYKRTGSTLSVLTTVVEEPLGYGRILRNSESWLEKIVEEKDASEEERTIREINTGIYCVKAPFLKQGLAEIGRENAQGEYYLTDLVEIAKKKGLRCSAHVVADPLEVMGINTRVDLATANDKLRQEKLKELMLSGVTVVDPQNTYVDRPVEVGKDSILYPNCYLQGKTTIGERCILEPNSKISDSLIGDDVTIRANSVITESKIEEGAEPSVPCPFEALKRSKEQGEDWEFRRGEEVISAEVRKPIIFLISAIPFSERTSTSAPGPLPATTMDLKSIRRLSAIGFLWDRMWS
jgi:bifunctional UDP-N-acetylglucosamine pyrophosphorylase/glucosamine-1-phosphate N-acetyltransferase